MKLAALLPASATVRFAALAICLPLAAALPRAFAADPPAVPASSPTAAPEKQEKPEAGSTATRLSLSAATPIPMSGIIDPAARSLLEESETAQAALNSYSANVTLRGSIFKEPIKTRLTLAYQKSGKIYKVYLRVEDEKQKSIQTFVSDGKDSYSTDSSSPKTYTRLKATPEEGIQSVIQLIAQSDAGLLASLPLAVVTSSSTDVTKDVVTVVSAPDEIVDGAARAMVKTVSVETSTTITDGVTTTNRDLAPKLYAIGKTDHLLRLCRTAVSGGGEADHGTEVLTVTFTDVKANPKLSPSLFVFTPPPGAKMTEASADAEPTPATVTAPAAMPASGTSAP